MPKIKLITSYRTWAAGEILETDKAKCEELVSLGRAEWVEKEEPKKKRGRKRTKEMKPARRKRTYKTKAK